MYKGDVTAKYERARLTAQQKVDQEKENEATAVPMSTAAASGLTQDEGVVPQGASTPRISRKKASSISSTAGTNFKDLTNKVNQNLHGRRANVLGLESSH
jgi:sphinganine C4-monooxygenase